MTPNFLVFIIGTRAQLIKVAPVIVACERKNIPLCLLMTGQHRETMLDLIAEFAIRTPLTIAVTASERSTLGSLFRWVPSAYLGIRACLRKISAQYTDFDVIVHGDTLSTVLGSLAGRRAGARVVHLESGLTSGRLLDPFPEEMSRRIVFRLTDVAICPNADAANYMRNNYHCEVMDTKGNTILDAVALVKETLLPASHRCSYFVVSLHRFQNIYDSGRLRELVALIEALATAYPIYFVLHPATRKRLINDNLLDKLAEARGVMLSPRLGYADFLRLVAGAACVLTDGGSNQEELAALGVPTIVMRKATERPDGLGANIMMEGGLQEDVRSFLLAGKFESLKRPAINLGAEGPAERIADYLASPAGFE
jgi:UDP-N-acetylglucosamine 2-epimerase (non-hydrolysing)